MRIFQIPLLLCLILPLAALSQSNYRPGYIIKNNGDTLKGYINYRTWKKSPKSIEFKQTITAKTPVIFDAPALNGFKIPGFDSYVAYIGPISTDKNNMPDLPNHLDVSTRLDSVFLKVISTGPNVSLLQSADTLKERYFIMDKNSAPTELVFHQYYDEGKIGINAPFRNQLAMLLNTYARGDVDAGKNVLDANFTQSALIKYVRIINHTTAKETGITLWGTRLFVGAGAAYNYSSFAGPPGFAYAPYASSVSPLVSFGIDILSNPRIQKSFLRIEVSAMGVSPTFTGYAANFSVNQYIASITPQFIYNIYNTDKFKFFIDAGVGFAIATNSSKLVANQSGIIISPTQLQNLGDTYVSLKAGDTYSNPYDVKNTGINIQLKTGVVINRKIELYIATIPYSPMQQTDYYSYQTLTTTVGVNYFFGGK